MDNKHYAKVLSDIAALLQIKGANRFRIRAMENAARTVSRLSEPIDEYVEQDKVEELKGIGASIAEDIRQIHETGTCQARTELLEELDPGLLDLLEIQGLGPKRIKKIYEELGITEIDVLRQAAEAGRVAEMSGFGAKTQQNILDEIDRLSRKSGRTPLPVARRTAEALKARLQEMGAVDRVEIAGSLRRGRETIGDVDLLVATNSPTEVARAFVDHREIEDVLAQGAKKTSVRMVSDLQVDLRFVDDEIFGSALHYFTGSKEHHVELRTRAKKQGMKISEYGVFEVDEEGEETSDEPVASRTEEEVFGALGLSYIPPEIREGAGEIELAAAGELPELLEEGQVRGDLHMHTTETDGSHSIRQMAEAARDMGLDYIAITDHSQAVTVANGMTPERFEAHIAAIREVDEQMREESGFRVLAGIEVDILKDGDLDMDAGLLEEADWVVGSIHSHFKQESAKVTERLIAAVETGLVDALGHPTGRILGGRDGYSYDMEAVLEAVLDNGVAMEMNGSSGRLDLNAEMARMVRDKQVKLVFGSDAHSTGGLEDLRYSVQQARRGWLRADDVLNTWSAEEIVG